MINRYKHYSLYPILRLTVAVATAPLPFCLLCIAGGQSAFAQVAEGEITLTLGQVNRLAVEQSPEVRAATLRLSSFDAVVRGAGTPPAARVEVAPGVGFTNGNALLSLPIDIAGGRTANRVRAEREREVARVQLAMTRLQVVSEAQIAYLDMARAQGEEATATELLRLTEELLRLVRRRVEIGEVPAIQQTRAEIEVARAEQEVIKAQAEAVLRRATLNRLVGRSRNQSLVLADSLALPESPLTIETLLESALQNRPEAALIRAELALRQGTLTVAERATRPTLSADLTADAWSLDPYSYRQRTAAGNLPLFGVQLRLGFPLGKDGAQQAEIARARAEVAGQEAQREAVHRRIILEVESNLANLTAARTVALRYQDVIVPKAEELYRATRAGYENGLSSLPEVLEAQRTLYQTRREFGSALYHAARAHVLLDAALGTLPKEVTP